MPFDDEYHLAESEGYFDDPGADVILRSSDNIDFRFFRLLLSRASPVFADMFKLPQPEEGMGGDERRDGLQVIENLGMKGDILKKLLMYCDPRCAPKLTTIDEKLRLFEMARKFEMAGVARRVGIEAAPRGVLSQKHGPLRAFAIACLRLEAVAREAAKATLQIPLSERSYLPELELIPASTLQRLHDYHFSCLNAARRVPEDYPQWIVRWDFAWFQCTNRMCRLDTKYGGRVVATWWADYMKAVCEAFKERPSSSTVLRPEVLEAALASAGRCDTCRPRAFRELKRFGEDIFAPQVEKVISEVSGDVFVWH
jgi:hypothetical protein